MTDPITSTATLAITAAGITILGISTGLQPDIMMAGFAGGLWAISYQPPIPVFRRISSILGAAIVSGYLTPLVVSIVKISLPTDTTREIVQNATGLLIGLIAQSVIGPAVLRIAAQKAKAADND